jgi:KipI family sensor histidine kinase inhibitor
MVQKYTSSDFNLFNKIDLSKDDNRYVKKSFIKKDISEKPTSSYQNKDKNKFDLLESHLGNNKINEDDNLFFSQKNIDDYSDFKKMYPHNIKNPQAKVSRPSVKRHINSDGSIPKPQINDVRSNIFHGEYAEPKFLPGGDKYLLVEFGNVMNLELNFKAQGLAKAIGIAKIKGVYETLPCFASMIVHYNSDEIKFNDLKKELVELVKSLKSSEDAVVESRLFKFPTVYLDKWTKEAVDDYKSKIAFKKNDPEFIVELNNLENVDHFVRLHSGTEYWVASLGFWPGLPFTMPLDPRCKLTAPKYNPPRTWTPRGTVGMGGSSTAIYPDRLPGGYQIFGRTPVPIWDPDKRFSVFKNNICLFKPGDRIKFDPCSYEEFEAIERKVEEGSYQFEVNENHKFSIKEYKKWLSNLDMKKKF